MIFVEAPPTDEQLGAMLAVGGLRYFRCRTNQARAELRARIEEAAHQVGVSVKCQGVKVDKVYLPVLKVEFRNSYPLPAYGQTQVQEDNDEDQ